MVFPISNYDSEPISDEDMMAAQYARIQKLQLLLFYKHPALRDLALQNCGTVASRKYLLEHVEDVELQELKQLVIKELRWGIVHLIKQAFLGRSCMIRQTEPGLA